VESIVEYAGDLQNLRETEDGKVRRLEVARIQ
jgi:hypothetical protein